MRRLRSLIPLLLVAAFAAACGSNGPDLGYLGTYSLQTVGDASLPAAVIVSYTDGSKDTTVIRSGTLTLSTDGGFSFSDAWTYLGFGSRESGSTFCSGEYGVDADGAFSTDGAITCSDETQISRVYGTWSGNRLDLRLVFVDLGVITAGFQK